MAESIDVLVREAVALQQAGRYADVRRLCERILAAQPGHPEALHLCALAFYREADFAAAIERLGKAIEAAPRNPIYHANLGNILKDAGRRDDAVAAYRRALELDPRQVAARNNLGVMLLERGDLDAASEQFRAVIDQRPDHFRAHFNLGNVLYRRDDIDGALAAWRRSLALQPQFADALARVGLALLARGAIVEALPPLRRRAELEPASPLALADLALALHRHGDFAQAAACYERAVSLAPEAIEVLCNYCALLLKICDWERVAVHLRSVVRAIDEARPGVPLGLLVSQPEFTAQMQLAAARANAAALPPQPALSPPRIEGPRERLRIGYLSADFREHATAWLTAELFELHDRERFEVVLFSYGPDDGGPTRRRLQRGADRFVDLAQLSDRAAAQRIVDERIDILLDLNGNTDNGRMGIAACRPAPVQVNWLGFPGTLGAEAYDYLVADPIVVPPGGEGNFTEAVVRLPDCYQSHDRRRARPDAIPDRRASGLAADALVMCCFNQSFKITAPMFALWMRVLGSGSGHVVVAARRQPGGERIVTPPRRGARRRSGAPRVRAASTSRRASRALPPRRPRHRHVSLRLSYHGQRCAVDAMSAGHDER